MTTTLPMPFLPPTETDRLVAEAAKRLRSVMDTLTIAWLTIAATSIVVWLVGRCWVPTGEHPIASIVNRYPIAFPSACFIVGVILFDTFVIGPVYT